MQINGLKTPDDSVTSLLGLEFAQGSDSRQRPWPGPCPMYIEEPGRICLLFTK